MSKDVTFNNKEQGNKRCLAPILKQMMGAIRVLMVASLFVVSFPSWAQEALPKDTISEGKNDTTVVASNSGEENEDETFYDLSEEKEEESESNSLPLLLSIVAIALSLVSIVIIYQQVKMKKKDNLADKIALLQKSMEEMGLAMDGMKAEIEKLKKAESRHDREVVVRPTPREEEISRPITTYTQPVKPAPAPQEKKESVQTLYANGMNSGEKVTLKEVDARFETQATFVIKAKGTSGTYMVNTKAVAGLLGYIGSTVNPYCDTAIDSTVTPSRIETIEEGTVEKKGAFWVVTKKAKVRVM